LRGESGPAGRVVVVVVEVVVVVVEVVVVTAVVGVVVGEEVVVVSAPSDPVQAVRVRSAARAVERGRVVFIAGQASGGRGLR
jgi:hypothetical protein